MIILDNNILISLCIWDEHAKQIEFFLSIMNEPIGIPTPVIAEFCAIDNGSRTRYLMAKHQKHEKLPFDELAAIVCAEITGKINSLRNSQGLNFSASRQKLKIDLLIVSIALARKASIILSNDCDIKKIIEALGLPITVYAVSDLCTDISSGPLFQQ